MISGWITATLFVDLPNRLLDELQDGEWKAQDDAARILLPRQKVDLDTRLLLELHWLSVRTDIDYNHIHTVLQLSSWPHPSPPGGGGGSSGGGGGGGCPLFAKDKRLVTVVLAELGNQRLKKIRYKYQIQLI